MIRALIATGGRNSRLDLQQSLRSIHGTGSRSSKQIGLEALLSKWHHTSPWDQCAPDSIDWHKLEQHRIDKSRAEQMAKQSVA